MKDTSAVTSDKGRQGPGLAKGADNAKKLRYCDKLLADQREHTYLYQGSDYAEDLFSTICHSSGISEPHVELDLLQTDRFTIEEMASNPVSLRFLQFLVRASNTRRVLEIGAFIGVSAIYLARALPADGEVVTIEKFDHFAKIARQNFSRNGVAGKVRLIEGDAREVLATLPRDKPFDLVFIDGNKERYKEYVELTEPLLSPRGIVAVDDCFFHGDAVNGQPSSEKGAGVRAVLRYAATREDLLRIALPLANGILLMMRR